MRRTTHRFRMAAAVAATALAALSLTSCASGGGGGAGDGGSVNLQYGIWDQEQQPAMEKIIAAFEKENPNITVKIQLTPCAQYWTKLQTAATGGSAPDVFWMNGPEHQALRVQRRCSPRSTTGRQAADYSEGPRRHLHLRRQALRRTEGLRHHRRLVQQEALRRRRRRVPEGRLDLGRLPRRREGADRQERRASAASRPPSTTSRPTTTRSRRPAATSSATTARSRATTTRHRSGHRVLDRPDTRRRLADAAADDRHRRQTCSPRARSPCTGAAPGAPTFGQRCRGRRITSTSRRCRRARGRPVRHARPRERRQREVAAPRRRRRSSLQFAERQGGRGDPGRGGRRHPRLQRHPAALGRVAAEVRPARSSSTSSRPPCRIPSRRTPRPGRRCRTRPLPQIWAAERLARRRPEGARRARCRPRSTKRTSSR